jgi:hypothetical protein
MNDRSGNLSAALTFSLVRFFCVKTKEMNKIKLKES